MHLSLLAVTGLAVFATALPQRPGGGRFRGGRPFDQNAQGNGVQAAQPADPTLAGAQPPAVVPDNAQDVDQGAANQQGTANDQGNLNNQGTAGNQGDLNNQGAGNANQNGTDNTNNANNGQNQNGQNQNGQDQAGQDQAGAFDPALVPEFGVQAGQNPDGQGNCDGLNGIKIPCQCPPDRQDFIQRVQAAAAAGNSEGVPVEFPLDDSSASKKARIQTSIIVLQNLNGRGVGCPAASTTFLAQQAAA
ncbi:hypothetical protein N0V90_008021 [Kalmusia sp. IMI 367209]|nr:hypothetical protein N0V90_008021 [Kalmusia sp. IMI 367209]